MVTAFGEIITVTKDTIEMMSEDGELMKSMAAKDPRRDSDLWFGLQGAGASFGVITEFLVKAYPVPETLASVIPIWVSSFSDLRQVQKAAESKQGRGYQWGLYSLYYFRAIKNPWAHPLQALSLYVLRLQVTAWKFFDN